MTCSHIAITILADLRWTLQVSSPLALQKAAMSSKRSSKTFLMSSVSPPCLKF